MKKNKQEFSIERLTEIEYLATNLVQKLRVMKPEMDDFVHCTNYWTSWNNELVLNPAALESILSKELRYVGSKYPICSLVRLRKFIARGWRINAGQILKMAMQVSELDLTDIDVLEDQLTGVDTSYFVQLIKGLRDKDPDKVDHAYLVEIIDRMF